MVQLLWSVVALGTCSLVQACLGCWYTMEVREGWGWCVFVCSLVVVGGVGGGTGASPWALLCPA